MTPDRRRLLIGAGAMLAAPRAWAADLPLMLDGTLTQGGFVMGRTQPGALVFIEDEALTTASDDGLFIVGFDRDAPATATLDIRAGDQTARRVLTIQRGAFPSSRIDGLPPSTVEPADPALLERIRRESAMKAEGFASRADADYFRDGFVWPLESYRVSSPCGSQRILNGTPARPHYGIDLAAPAGTPILSPAAGWWRSADPPCISRVV